VSVVEIYQSGSDKPVWRWMWYWRLKSANGEIVAQSEGYVTKWNAKRSARKLFPAYEIRDLTK
jgi:uncharacterized protein YegP (UPF0339 family)